MTGTATLPRPRTTAAVARTLKAASAHNGLPVWLRQRWEAIQDQPWVHTQVQAWVSAAPAALGDAGSASELDDRLGELWAHGQYEHVDQVLGLLLRTHQAGGPAGELAFMVLTRRLASAVLELSRVYRVRTPDLISTLWLLATDYPLERRPLKIAANLTFDLRKALLRDQTGGAREVPAGLIPDPSDSYEASSPRRAEGPSGYTDPALLFESSLPVHMDPAGIVATSPLPAPELVRGVLDWATHVIPAVDVEILTLVFASGSDRRMPLDQVATRVGLSRQATQQRLLRALKRLSLVVCTAGAASVQPDITPAPATSLTQAA